MKEYRIDEVASLAGTTVRNARVYQDRGLLPPPRKDGRVGWYSEEHLVRLRLIGRLLERGYTFSVIKELLDAWETGRDLREILGLEEELARPWTDELPGRITLLELRKMYGGNTNPRLVQRAEALGMVVRQGTSFVVPSPRLLQAGAELVALGVPIDDVLDVAEALRRDMDIVADRFLRVAVRTMVPEAEGTEYPDSERARDIAEIVRRLRPQASAAVSSTFATAMGRRVLEEVDEVTRRVRTAHPTAPGADGQAPAPRDPADPSALEVSAAREVLAETQADLRADLRAATAQRRAAAGTAEQPAEPRRRGSRRKHPRS